MQDPIIFSGTVRSNLDPFGSLSSDAQIWEALGRAGIKPAIEALEVSLSTHKHCISILLQHAFISHQF